VLRFEVAAETFALFRDALRELRRRAGTALDDDSALLEMARCVLGGPRDEGRASYQVVLSVCAECSSARQQAEGGLVPVGPELIRMAQCDAQHLPPTLEPSPLPANDLQPREGAEQQRTGDTSVAIESEAAHVCASTAESANTRATEPADSSSTASRNQRPRLKRQPPRHLLLLLLRGPLQEPLARGSDGPAPRGQLCILPSRPGSTRR
jgi:hypothetical protein